MPYKSKAREIHLEYLNSLPQVISNRFQKKNPRFIRSASVNGGGWYSAIMCGHETRSFSSLRCRKCELEFRKNEGLEKRLCGLCAESFNAVTYNQKWCPTCVPDKSWRARAQRYGIGKPQWEKKLFEQNGKCVLCDSIPTVVDHNHHTGNVRGLLCGACNLLVSGLDTNQEWMERAIKYISL